MGRAVRKLRAWCRRQQACSIRESGWASHTCWPGNSSVEAGQKSSLQRKREGRTRNGWEEGMSKGGKHFFREVGEESVRFDYLLLYLILFFRVTLRFLLIFRWLLWLPKEINLFLTFVDLIFVFSHMSYMLDIFCVCVLSSLRSSHQTLLKALLVFVMQSLVLVVLSLLIHCSVLLLFLVFFFFFFLFLHFSPLFLAFSGEETRACRNQASSTTPIFLSFILHLTPSLTWSLTGACYPSLLHIPIETTHPSFHIHTTHTHPSCYS